MNFNDYQTAAQKTAVYPKHLKVIYPALGLAGETGEVCEKIKKVYRDNNGNFTQEKVDEITKELGDALWYLSGVAFDIGVKFNDVAATNLEKLSSRQTRNTLKGSGDNR